MPHNSRLAALCALMLAAPPALAADFAGPYPPQAPGYEEREAPPPLRPEPGFRGPPRFERGPDPGPPEACREFVRRRLDADGEPVLRRVRVCDGPAFEREPPPPEPRDEIPPRRWGGPRW